jgi:hypothetical protein
MGMDALSIRRGRREDAPLLAAIERAIASVPGKLASRPEEIDGDAVRAKIIGLNDQGLAWRFGRLLAQVSRYAA